MRGAKPTRSVLILFDLDDTLFDHRACVRAGLIRIRREFAALGSLSLARMEREYHEVLEALHPRVIAGEIDPDAARRMRMRRLFEAAGTVLGEDAAARCERLYRDAYDAAQRPVRGALGLLRRLRGRAVLGIVTNNKRDEQLRKLRTCRLEGLPDFMVTPSEAGAMKPQPEIFRLAVERAGSVPDADLGRDPASRAIVVGDSWATDVEGARAAGLRPVWLNRLRAASPDPSVPELAGLVPVAATSARLLDLAASRPAGEPRAEAAG